MVVRRSDAQASTALVDALVQLSFAVHDVVTRAAAHYELSVTQVRLLGILRDRTPPMTAIAEYLGLDRSSVTGLVDRAERRGLVLRTAATHDGRVTTVRITAEGKALGSKLAGAINLEIEELAKGLARVDRLRLIGVVESILGVPSGVGERTA